MTHGDDSQVDRHRVDAFASEDELTVQARRDAVVTFETSSQTALLPRDRVDI
jgi:hypothetical protein